MNPVRLRFRLLLATAALCLATAALADAPTDAKASFTSLKALEGAWEGGLTTDLKTPDPSLPETTKVKVWLRVTSRGNALLHEMKMEGRPDDPITMLYLDEGRLLLTHYCDAGNRPRMVAKPSTDGKTIAFDFLDATGPMKYGHMHDAAFTTVDADHHIEEWTFHLAGDKHVRARFDLHRVK